MAKMSRTWSILTASTLLAVLYGKGEKSCAIWSSAGHVVQRGSSFKVYCTFDCKCTGSMFSDHPPTRQRYEKLNSTTIYANVMNITKNRTYSCKCSCSPSLDPCGLDISAGYPPDRPKNISCIYKLTNDESGVVSCTWKRGRETYLKDSSVLWVRTVSGDHTDAPHRVSSKGTVVPRSVQLISVWVQAQNLLGSEVSATINYTLSDIVMPSAPVLGLNECSSRECTIRMTQSVRTHYLEIQYKAGEQIWTTYRDQAGQMSSVQDWSSISSLEPYRLYHFRARSKFSTGLWSEWSKSISGWTQEEAPAEEVDVWYAEPASDLKSLRIYWKEANMSVSRGKILGYKLRVYNPNSGLDHVANVSADTRSYSISFCANCEVTVWARNSKGLSPPARITARHTAAQSPQDVQFMPGNHSVTISWRNPETALLPAAYVVEWYPLGYKLEELRWVRLGRNDNRAVITGLKTFECYEVVLYVFYGESSVNRTTFAGVTTLESAPAAGPLVQEKVKGNKVTVTWTEPPRGQRGGCITKYTIYLDSSSEHQQHYSVAASERMYVTDDLSPGFYSLWMTASTAKGEGPAGQKVKFFIQQETQLSLLLICGVISLIILFLLCLCQSSAVKQRFWVFFQCLMLDIVPDPANSKWAKECTQEKGKINIQLQLSNSAVNEEEGEPILVDVEELPRLSDTTPTNVSSQSPLHTNLTSEPALGTLLYPLTTYIKSFSHDSDSSDHTQTSLDTNTTVEYISSHGLEIMAEEDQEDEEFGEMLGSPHSHNILMEPLDFGGKLTLDAVKIDCSDFFQSN
uniref:Fibronectin type-III domain-containing protein n=1 Tax=Monopterus albus TaxID=43700 RepID=A0A3Q3KPL9_MONAL|nr:interleukin-12 receptor subunit beta-2-like [Monopterus albus]XP_020467897.1 interleukin-12 receptor subunit beta-2-like [Monopterus albus]XP_020467898.1 interleukin-12 receptor subunit beta-2-like [Monopterus albus]